MLSLIYNTHFYLILFRNVWYLSNSRIAGVRNTSKVAIGHKYLQRKLRRWKLPKYLLWQLSTRGLKRKFCWLDETRNWTRWSQDGTWVGNLETFLRQKIENFVGNYLPAFERRQCDLLPGNLPVMYWNFLSGPYV